MDAGNKVPTRGRIGGYDLWSLGCLAASLLSVVGCSQWLQPTDSASSPLRPMSSSAESIALEIFSASFPYGDEELNGPIWSEIDEQQIPTDVRRGLVRNGFRAGIVGGNVPDRLAQLLKLTDQPASPNGQNDLSVEFRPTVIRRIMQIRSGRSGQYLSSEVYDQMSLLLCGQGQVYGASFQNGQCIFAITATRQRDGRVQLELVPELHHGQPRKRFDVEDGILRPELTRPKKGFEDLHTTTLLSPGQMLVASAMPDRPGSLGHHFFTKQSAHGQEQKMLFIRLAHVPPSDLFDERLRDGLK